MSYTATTIGFGEIPYAFTPLQRMWVTGAIFASVIGWAYAIGSLLALSQDKAFRQVIAQRGFVRAVRIMGEPFFLIVGYGNAGRMLGHSLDDMGRRFVVLDHNDERTARVELDGYLADAPAMTGNARDTATMILAGLGHRHCEGVIAVTADDETNLDVTMTTHLLRPNLPVFARCSNRDVAERMLAFHAREVINPLDRFGDHLRIMLRSPAAYQLMMWLTSAPGTPLPARCAPWPRGRWVVCGHGRFGEELSEDLRAEGLEVTVVHVDGGTVKAGAGDTAAVVVAGDVADAVAYVAATDNDTTNLWLVEAAHRANPEALVVALHNRRANAGLYEAIGVDFGMLPADLIAHEVQARIVNPALMRFLPDVPHQSDEWSAALVDRLVASCGTGTPDLWAVRLSKVDAPALAQRLAGEGVPVGLLLRDPGNRNHSLHAVPLLVLRDGQRVMAPADDFRLRLGDQVLLAGGLQDQRLLETVLEDPSTASYVFDGSFLPSSWVWRRFSSDKRNRGKVRSG
jgi:Trk K+ transport system NAD-binding subunit